jgi:transposase
MQKIDKSSDKINATTVTERKIYTHEVKIFAIFSVLLNFMSIKELSQKLNISDSIIYRWVSEYKESSNIGLAYTMTNDDDIRNRLILGYNSGIVPTDPDQKLQKEMITKAEHDSEIRFMTDTLSEIPSSVKAKFVDKGNSSISLRRQCELLALPRSVLYYKPTEVSIINLTIASFAIEHFKAHPAEGINKITADFNKLSHPHTHVNKKRVARIVKELGLRTIYTKPKRNLSVPNLSDKKYPYLLKNTVIDKPNKVWCTDITYVKVKGNFVYLSAIMDWYSRYVLAWRLDITAEAVNCAELLADTI